MSTPAKCAKRPNRSMPWLKSIWLEVFHRAIVARPAHARVVLPPIDDKLLGNEVERQDLAKESAGFLAKAESVQTLRTGRLLPVFPVRISERNHGPGSCRFCIGSLRYCFACVVKLILCVVHCVFPFMNMQRVRPWPTLESKPWTHPCRSCELIVQLRTAHLQDLVVVLEEWQASEATCCHPCGPVIIQRSQSNLEIPRKLSLLLLNAIPSAPHASLFERTHMSLIFAVPVRQALFVPKGQHLFEGVLSETK